MAIMRINLVSKYLMLNTNVTVILPNKPGDVTPKEFYSSGERYKVLWLLHGGGGDAFEWLRNTGIERYACENNLAVVMPSAMNSAYSNWSEDESFISYPMFDYLLEELMPLVYDWFPISDKREDNFVAGFSMGGQGALMYAVNRPDRFGAAGVLGVATVKMRVPEGEIPRNPTGIKMLKAAEKGQLEEYLNSYENVWDKMQDIAKLENPPRMLFAMGTLDHGYPFWLAMKEYTDSIGLKATYEAYEGHGHDYRCGDLVIQRAIEFFLNPEQ